MRTNRWLLGAAVSIIGVPVAAQMPPGANPDTGARPGNEIGTGSSLPYSDRASNITPQDTRSMIAPNLPSPSLGASASVRDYLGAARTALLQNRTGAAQQSLEMAETRALDRSVPLFQTSVPDKNPLIGDIQQALKALSTGDRMLTLRAIETAISHAQ
ncbi:MAG TPA: hypothetical protein VFL55_01600 [Acetobacteraceae bacterium]|nr:hypothetical protein [Acetobacteraceae bacterium]